MAGAGYPSGVLDQAAFDTPYLSGISGNSNVHSVPLTNPPVQTGDPCMRLVGELFDALIDVPPNAWLFV
jgi:hypothetical protein